MYVGMYVLVLETVVVILMIVFTPITMYVLKGFKVVRPTHRGIIEGKRQLKFVQPGTMFVPPGMKRLRTINITETLLAVKNFQVTTKDGIECTADVDVYYKISEIEDCVKKILYEIRDYRSWITNHVKKEIYNTFRDYDLKEIPEKELKISRETKDNLMEISKYFTITNIELKKLTPPENISESLAAIVEQQNNEIAMRKEMEMQRERQEEEKRLEREKVELKTETLKIEAEAKKRYIQEIAKTRDEAIKLVGESVKQNLGANKKFLTEMESDFKKASARKITENNDE